MIIAPEATHLETRKQCDASSYLARGWCRFEQWARMTTGGLQNMYIWVDSLKPLRDNASWVKAREGWISIQTPHQHT